MPMYQGNYAEPVWVNGVPPAINDTELAAMSGTIQDSQILTGSGAPTQYVGGVPGQRYRDSSATPNTIWRLVTAAENANVWVRELKTVGSITLSASWGGSGPYVQTVTVTGATVTARSKVDLQPTAAQMASLISDGVSALLIENNGGTLTAYAVGAAPSAAMTVQCTVEETT